MRERTPQRVSQLFYFSQKNTDEQNTQHSTETLSQPITQNFTANRSLTPSPSPNGEGSDHRDTPTYSPILSSPIGVTSHTTPLSIRRGVGGEASVNSVCRRHSVGSKRAQKGSVNSVCSVRDKTPHDSYWQAYRGNLTFHSPPYGGGTGGGASWCRVLSQLV